MEVGSLVRHYELIGIVIGTKHDNFSQIYWTDVDEPGGSIIVWWENIDVEVIG
tara:strand:+ start:422 stop:580 length:159 start_codon:yes stop_codon:yes gene_type:complete